MSKRKILVVDDQKVNIAILKKLLSDKYEVLTADSGEAALAQIAKCGTELSAVLLDIVMPGMDGYEVLREIRKNQSLKKLPVIVVTQPNGINEELKALELGATDFAIKPYNGKVLRRRLRNIIELRETAEYINVVERDPLTGVLNAEAFARAAEKLIKANPGQEYELFCSDIERFKLVNDLFGKAEGDNLLRFGAELYREMLPEGCVVGRVHSDIFAALAPSGVVTKEFVKEFTERVAKYPLNITLALKTGVCRVDNADVPMSVICDRAMLAADSIKGQYDKYIAYYDESMRQKMIKEQFMIDNMRPALERGQFSVYLQPKYDIEAEKVAGAEALVRWIHPKMGFMSPGEFIPLFEKNGFVTEIDMFVWDKACETIRYWLDTYHTYVPISVNVSRVDIMHPDLVDILMQTVRRHGLTPHHLHLEITETAYTENSKQLIDVVGKLKSLGFNIEMDDFGSGYSSLNMLSELPINILKLDMALVQHDALSEGDSNIVSFIISLAKRMNLKVVAEGVETVEQLEALRAMGCGLVQGYFYAKPMPIKEFNNYFENGATMSPDDAYRTVKKGITVPIDADDKVLLVVDDIQLNRVILSGFFSDSFTVAEAENGKEALEYIKENKDNIAVILLDLVMPVMDGFQLLSRLKADADLQHIPVIVTSYPSGENEAKVLELGAADFIGKPYNKAVARCRVRNVLDSAAYEKSRKKEIG